MKRLALGLLLSVLACCVAQAQTNTRIQAQAVATCGGQALTAGVWYPATQDLTGTLCTQTGGGGSTAVTIANGADVAEGSTTDAAATQGGTGTVSAKLRLMTSQLNTIATTGHPITGTVAVTQSTSPWVVSGTITTTPPSNASTNVAQINGVTPLMGNGVTGTGSPRVTIASDNTAFSVNSVQSGTWTVQPGNTANTTPWLVTPTPATSGGLTTFFLQPTASDNHAVIKAGAGQVYYILAMNNSATVNYLRLYNATTGFNGCNSATNLITQVQIPASTSVGGVSIPLPFGLPFSTGISICVTSGYATTDTTNATASAMSVTVGYN